MRRRGILKRVYWLHHPYNTGCRQFAIAMVLFGLLVLVCVVVLALSR